MTWKRNLSLPAIVLLTMLVPRVAPAEKPDRFEIDRLDWLAGCWQRGDDRNTSEECWLPSAGGILLGVHRDVRGERASFEFLRIAQDEDGVLTYYASPGGQPPAPFALREAGAQQVVFENPQHDFPQRIRYWLDPKGALHARIEGQQDGETSGIEWTWTRVPGRW